MPVTPTPRKLLIDYGIDIDKQGPYNGYTALHDATWQNNVDVAKVLIDADADLDHQVERWADTASVRPLAREQPDRRADRAKTRRN